MSSNRANLPKTNAALIFPVYMSIHCSLNISFLVKYSLVGLPFNLKTSFIMKISQMKLNVLLTKTVNRAN